MTKLKNAIKRVRQRFAVRSACVSAFFMTAAVAVANAQADPFTTTAQSWETMLTGTFAQLITVAGIAVSGVPVLMGHGGDHKGKLMGTAIGGTIILCAQRIVSTLIGQ